MATYHINRSRNLTKILDGYGWLPASPSEIADFGMWFGCGKESRIATCELFNGQITRLLDDKLCMYELLSEFNLQDLTLNTFSRLPGYLEFLNSTNSTVFCFLKTTLGAGGTGVYAFNNLKDLIHAILENNNDEGQMIIQQGVRNVALIDERKFKIRTYVLITADWQAYVYRDSLVVLHNDAYSPESTSPSVQLSPDCGNTAMLLNEAPGITGLDEKIYHSVNKSINCLQKKSVNMENKGSYHLFGYDFICDKDKRVYLIETNGFPNTERNDAVGRTLSEKMMLGLKRLIIDPMVLGSTPAPSGFIRVC
jgi:hypothetical protein